ncbi:Flp pilus assembly protein TadB [Terriglobus roseus DSM 18391]|uniref:Flp pilus assembly protein TadB n=1 Tax=Terriglobus roseus (strain DSM 18391 / NRRL B-41598 / KBS 63) TaxID=926566 RepID=I3ZLH9_TERRK|nr:type II secretion system F family protein [Terriglobus roseus]AFL90097.1 Flp pilus assembly protein TadB [Terriglobus roseus DSM 18391]
MTLLVLVFFATSTMCFCALAILLRPRPEQTALNQRLAALVSQDTMPAGVGELLLKPSAQTGAFGWSDDMLAEAQLFENLKTLKRQARVDGSVSALILTSSGIGLSALVLTDWITGNLLAALAIAACLAYLPILRLQMRRKRRIAAFDAVLPDAIELCARSLRAGHSLIGAIGNVAEQGPEPVKSEFAEVFRLQNFGLPIRDALMQLMDRMPSADLRVVVTGIMVQKDTGGNLAEIMDHTTTVIRDRIRIKGEIQVHTAQGRLSGWILCLMPVVLLGAINLMSPGYSSMLFHDPLGQKLLYSSIVLLAIGGLIIRHIVNGIEV